MSLELAPGDECLRQESADAVNVMIIKDTRSVIHGRFKENIGNHQGRSAKAKDLGALVGA